MPDNICEFCGRTYDCSEGCDPLPIRWRGMEYLPIPYGQEANWKESGITPSPTCHDCGVKLGQYHHWGCDVEICPICGGQFLTCKHSIIADDVKED